MRVLAYYGEAIIPENVENITQDTEFLDGLVPFRCAIEEKTINEIQRIVTIEETDIQVVLNISKEVPIRFKVKDKIILFDKEYRVKKVVEKVPDKFKLRASKSKALYERYVEYTVFIGY